MQRRVENINTKNQSSVIEYSESDYLPYSDKKIFNLIADVARYPEFLPGWLSVDVISQTENFLSVKQKVGIPLVNWEFTSTAELDKPRYIHIFADDGPFRYLEIHWHIEPVTRTTCRVVLTVKADMSIQAMSMINTVLRQSIRSLLIHFSARAVEIYGQQHQLSSRG